MITLHNTLSMTSSQLCQVLGDRTVTAQVIKYQTLKYNVLSYSTAGLFCKKIDSNDKRYG